MMERWKDSMKKSETKECERERELKKKRNRNACDLNVIQVMNILL